MRRQRANPYSARSARIRSYMFGMALIELAIIAAIVATAPWGTAPQRRMY